ncbi:DUF370 domain-containing protein [bacterium]|nr:DUF370 domain-containing protein [bacterium]
MISVGYKNYIALDRIVAVISPDSRPIKNLVNTARDQGRLIDSTMGKKTKSVLVTDSNQVILSANSTETIIHRIQNYRKS